MAMDSLEELDCLNLITAGNESDNDESEGWNLKTFKFTDHNLHGFEQDLDPENNFLNNINNNCCYYSDDQFNMNIKSDYGLSIVHFNSRSLYGNFLYIKEYLTHLNNPFQVIAISETWLTSEKGVDHELNGYELNYVNRENKKGGGVALYVDRRLKYEIVKNM